MIELNLENIVMNFYKSFAIFCVKEFKHTYDKIVKI